MAGMMGPACSIEKAHVHRHCCQFAVLFADRACCMSMTLS